MTLASSSSLITMRPKISPVPHCGSIIKYFICCVSCADNLPNAGSGFCSQLLFYTIPPGPIPAWVEFADLVLITWKVSTCTSFLKCFLLRYAVG
jgi:hypothetical protein